MPKTAPALSICIPTCNRAPFLRELLEALANEDLARVEVVVSDNASQDGTEAVVAACSARIPRLRYHRNAVNIGSERNLLAAFDLAQGDRVWWFGDDDAVAPGGVARVVALIDQGHPVIIANARCYDRNLRNPGSLIMRPGRHAGLASALDALGPWITFMSAPVLRRADLVGRRALMDSRVGTFLFFTYPLVELIHRDGAMVTADEIVRYRSGNSGGYDLYRVFIIETGRLLDHCRTLGCAEPTLRRLERAFLAEVVIPCTLAYRVESRPLPPAWTSLRLLWQSHAPIHLCIASILARLTPRPMLVVARWARRRLHGRV